MAGPHDLYDSKPPWDIDRPQTALLRLAQSGCLKGSVLDIGCGTAEHALMAAREGQETTGVDQSVRAVELAEAKAHACGLSVRFICHDACRLAELDETFDTVIDCGLFHIFTDAARADYVDSLSSILAVGGRYFMLGFSDVETRNWGPQRLSKTEIITAFADGWQVDAIEPAAMELAVEPYRVAAWLVALTRR
ncbi:class I SAM-dependent methyltransferase [Mycolicibacterium peregrinum]|uniref:class I SAM-dependent methyltransferase n=1 Tax=Mycolicibacterium peregrinum TaxID=43304 RepID=UPI003AAC67FF